MSQVLVRVSQLAAGQWGLLTAAQAERELVPRYRLARLVDAGLLERLEQGVYAVTAAEADEHRRLRAAWLALDPAHTAEERLGDLVGSGVVSHTSAAGLYGLGDLLDDIPELTVATRRQTRRGVRLHRADLTTADVTLVDGLPTTTVERTVADLLRDGQDLDHVATILGEGVRHGLVDRDALATQLDSLARRHGRKDGHDLAEHLLDLVGLSTKALTRQVASSPIGQELVNAGAVSAIQRLIAGLPQPNVTMPTVDVSRFVSPQTTELMNSLGAALMPLLAQWASVGANVPTISPAALETIKTVQSAMTSPAALDAVAHIAESVPDFAWPLLRNDAPGQPSA